MLSNNYNIMSQILNQLSHWVWLKQYPSGVYVFANDAFCTGSGLKREDILGKTDFDLWPDEKAQHFFNRDSAVVSCKTPIVVREYTPGTHAKSFLIETFKFPIFLDGEVIGVAGIAKDVQWEQDLAHYMQQSVRELEQIVQEGR